MKNQPVPIPDSLLNRLSTRARRLLVRERIGSCESLLGFGPDDLRRFKGCGASTIHRLECLQDAILQRYPELSHYLKRQKVQLGEEQPRPEDPANVPVLRRVSNRMPSTRAVSSEISSNVPSQWSILNRTLPEVFLCSPLSSDQDTDPGPTIGGLGIPATDLEQLRYTAIYPEDPIHHLCSVSLGYLIEANVTDDSLTVLFEAILQLCGLAGLSSASLASAQVSDAALYLETDFGSWETLRVPGLCDPALREVTTRDSSVVTWREVAKLTERTVIERLGFSATALRAIRHLWQLKALALSLLKSAQAGLSPDAYGEFHHLTDAYLRVALSAQHRKPGRTSERDFRVLKARLGLVDGRKCTLAELGSREKVSGERVRQVEIKLLAVCQNPQTLQHLRFLWLWLNSLLAAGGGALCASEIAASLGDALGWTARPSDEALALFIALSPDYRVIWDQPIRVVMPSNRCVNCMALRSTVSRALANEPEGEITFDKACEIMRDFCQSKRCRGIDKVTKFSKGFLISDDLPL